MLLLHPLHHQRRSITFLRTLLFLLPVNKNRFVDPALPGDHLPLLINGAIGADRSRLFLVSHPRPGSPPLVSLSFLRHFYAKIFANRSVLNIDSEPINDRNVSKCCCFWNLFFFLCGFASARIPDNHDLLEAWHVYYLQILDLM